MSRVEIITSIQKRRRWSAQIGRLLTIGLPMDIDV